MTTHAGNDDVTVVITCFNYGRFLGEAVESALSQEGGKPRVIVVDDGSTEQETQRALSGLHESVDVVRQDNAGVSAARNAGIARASTTFLLVMDADDRLPAAAIRQLRSALDEHPRVGYAYGLMEQFGALEGVIAFPDWDPYRLIYRHVVGLSALVRREVFEATGGFDPAFAHYEDWELWVHALAKGWEGRRVDAVTLEYRRHPGNASKRTADRRAYRAAFRALRKKHAGLYENRDELGRRSVLGPAGRLAYRWFWGARPVPARLESLAHGLIWRGN